MVATIIVGVAVFVIGLYAVVKIQRVTVRRKRRRLEE